MNYATHSPACWRQEMASLQRQTFEGVDEKELQMQVDRLKQIRELSADYIAEVQKSDAKDDT